MPTPTMLMILDGWGWHEEREGNAVLQADTPNFDRLYAENPHAFLITCGPAVGLPEGQMGNSEVGHLNIGAGRVVKQELPRIDDAIKSGDLAARIEATGLAARVKETGGRVHLMGLVSPGGVHAHQDHAVAVAKILAEQGVKVVLHAFTDGRDTAPRGAGDFMAAVEKALPAGVAIGTVSGRYFAMDRDKRWERVSRAYDVIVSAKGERAATADEAIRAAYAADTTDEFIAPTAIGDYAGTSDGDALLFLNFRGDRAREILDALLLPGFDGWARDKVTDFAKAIGMVSYGKALDPVMQTLFDPQNLADGLSETVSAAGKTQIHMAETEKYPHVTYFLNGGIEAPFDGEDRVMVPSPKVATYDLQPEMSAPELTEKLLAAIEGGTYDLVVVNFANPDMVGHTGSLPAAIKAVETVDGALGKVMAAIEGQGGALIVTADHGNCETMIDPETGGPHTAHTLNPVPVVVMADGVTSIHDGTLADLSPTLLALMGVAQPDAMTGRSLID
ncbi:2,3-bisphosphoglycerate-independent phosphoglycerate mutase [Acuticoccus sp. MNP-M23]|uniref:2,3-bisphosphoglycerate-independent phosphoglycerate mutase n=1 Tax=Acuticoccus sp. MNP-M23 TaxID=3072793 RepID=UPI002815CEE8|nr:2,3-bisphosphoglycerate-independent phosphoglycerate mutase [Acuticoccus sp. MNP-M23]WMS44935.1 2,3-bisphosphoglycerate-independent phosphoglycerate mutase [Acuticoccus sp. MNP-M23]